MRTQHAILLFVLALASRPALAQSASGGAAWNAPAPAVISEATLYPSDSDSGAGFAPRCRTMFRTAAARWERTIPESPTLGSSVDFLTSVDVGFTDMQLMQQQLDQFNGSIELMAQHLWHGAAGSVNDKPALRLGIQNAAFALDVGQTPMADRSVLARGDSPTADRREWRMVRYAAYGIRADTSSTDVRFFGLTDIAGRVYSFTDRDELLIGPQLAAGMVAQQGDWLFDASLLALAGYRRVDTQQRNGFGDDALPGGVNNTLFLRPTYSRYEERATSYPIMGELRLITSYFFGSGLSLDVLANAVVEPPTQPTSPVVEYNAPDFGIGGSDSDSGNVVVGNLYLSLTYRR